jgi:heme exporter protein A
VALARLLANAARIWILDEPFTALDVAAVERLQDVIRRHIADGGMAIITTHQEVAMLAEHTRTIELGRRDA